MRGIRESHDIDIVVTNRVYNQLKANWEEKSWPDGGKYLVKEEFEICNSWNYGEYNPSIKELIKNADFFKGNPFIKLEEVLKWKKIMGREKDKKDIKLIEKYLSNKL